MGKPLVSIITPNYNGEKFIKNTIESVISQEYNNWELIIVDDNSTDISIEIIKAYSDKNDKIKFIQLNKNSGAAVARNTAIKYANGRFIAFLDGDDQWRPNKLKIQIELMLQNNFPFTYTSYSIIDEQGFFVKKITSRKIVNYKDLLKNNYIGCLTVIYDTKIIGKIYMPLIKKRQDWGLWLLITKKGYNAIGIKNDLALYTKRKQSLSSSKINLIKYTWIIYYQVLEQNFIKSMISMVRYFYYFSIK